MKDILLYCLIAYIVSQGIFITIYGGFHEWTEYATDTWAYWVAGSWLAIFIISFFKKR